MDCPHCSSSKTVQRTKLTKLGYKTFKCHGCSRSFNERTGTPFNRLCVRTEIVFEVVLWRLRYKLSLRDLSEMFLVQGYVFDHETVRHWEEQFTPLLSDELKAERHGKATLRWKMDETLLKVAGKYHYLYRCIDNEGKLVDVQLSPVRDQAATDAFFEQAVETVGHKPVQVTTDGEQSYPKAIDKILGCSVEHRVNRYANNRLEQDHRPLKERYYPMLGFKSFESAARFCEGFEEQRNYFRFRRHHKHKVSQPLQRVHILGKFQQLKEKFINKKLGWRQTLMPLKL